MSVCYTFSMTETAPSAAAPYVPAAVILTPAARHDAAALRAVGQPAGGVLLGVTMGKITLVERLLPLSFPRTRVGRVYGILARQYGRRLLGAFFLERRPFPSDWLLGDLVLEITAAEMRCHRAEFIAGGGMALLPVPFLEEAP